MSVRSPAFLLVALASFASILVSVSYRIDDPDLFQHLAVGRWVWMKGAAPLVHEWTWPLWGTPDVNGSWGFEALLSPFWERGGLTGLFLWRWLTTAATFALIWAAARRMGARGLAPALVLAVCGLTYRLRSDMRPETLSSVLMAAMFWILETRRRGGPDRTPWLVALAWVWANTHVSYYLGLGLVALYALDAAVSRRGDARRLAIVGLAAAAVSFVNPFGWRALAQPFEYVLFWRHEPVFRDIGELKPLDWKHNWRGGLPLVMAGWPLLALWRIASGRRLRPREPRVDLVELALCGAFTVQALAAQRFLGTYSLVAALFVSRDLSEWLASLAARRAGRPRLPLGARAGLIAAGCLAVGPLEWSRWDVRMGIAMDHTSYPLRACEFMAAHGVGGRGLNNFGMSGWQIYRFWPDRARLPFIDIHVSGTREDRDLYAFAQTDSNAWARLDAKHRFDYALIPRVQFGGDRLLNTLDADSAFALVFKDDVAALFVRRAGAHAPVAERFAYRVVPAGNRAIGRLGAASAADTALRARVRGELEREVRESPWHGQATSLLANLALIEARWAEARARLDTVLAIDPRRPRLHQRLGLLDLIDGRPGPALRHFAREVEIHGPSADLDLAKARAWAAQGRWDRARAGARRALARDPAHAEASDSLAAWEGR